MAETTQKVNFGPVVALYLLLTICTIALCCLNIGLGAKWQDKLCSKNDMPLALIILGVLNLVYLTTNFMKMIGQLKTESVFGKPAMQTLFTWFGGLCGLGAFGVLIWLTVLVAKTSSNLCYAPLYKLGLATVIITWCAPVFLFGLVCCAATGAVVAGA